MSEKFVSKKILAYLGDYANLYTKHISWKIYISYFWIAYELSFHGIYSKFYT